MLKYVREFEHSPKTKKHVEARILPERKARPDTADFYRLARLLRNDGFSFISSQEMKDERYRYGIISNTKDPGRETGFRYSKNGYTVRVWTSFVEKSQTYKIHDNGFVLIARASDNYVVYWGKTLRRTKNFADNIFMLAKKCRQVVDGVRPCPDEKCRRLLQIVPGRGGKGRMYACLNDELHGRGKGPTVSIDSGLDAEMLAYAKAERRRRDRDRKDPRRKSSRGSGFGNRRPRHVSTFEPV